MIQPNDFYEALCKEQADFFVGVPDSLLQNFCAYLQKNVSENRHIITANEGNAIAMAGGYHVATGRYGVVYMQNSGIGNAVNPLLSLADEAVYALPMLLVIGYRGEPGVPDEPQHITQGAVTFPLLDTLHIPYLVLEDDYQPQLEACFTYLKEQQKPMALVVKKGTFAPCEMMLSPTCFSLKREEALTAMLQMLRPTDFVVSTTGKTSRELFELREQAGQPHTQDFLTVGGMGHTASIAMGMAIGTEQPVYCIDGDGSFLMHMGSLAIVAQTAPPNFKYILINNGAHESVGGQPTVALALDIPLILQGMGIEQVYTAKTCDEIFQAMGKLKYTANSALVVYVDQGSRENLGRPTISPAQNKREMMAMFQRLLENKP